MKSAVWLWLEEVGSDLCSINSVSSVFLNSWNEYFLTQQRAKQDKLGRRAGLQQLTNSSSKLPALLSSIESTRDSGECDVVNQWPAFCISAHHCIGGNNKRTWKMISEKQGTVTGCANVHPQGPGDGQEYRVPVSPTMPWPQSEPPWGADQITCTMMNLYFCRLDTGQVQLWPLLMLSWWWTDVGRLQVRMQNLYPAPSSAHSACLQTPPPFFPLLLLCLDPEVIVLTQPRSTGQRSSLCPTATMTDYRSLSFPFVL